MGYLIRSDGIINYNPKNDIEDVIRNVHMILRIFQTEQPLDRSFSLEPGIIDKKVTQIRHYLFSFMIKKLKEYEPRAILKNLDIEIENDGEIIVVVEIEVMQWMK